MSPGETIFVTGGAGYIGSHICKALARAGCFPIAFDNLQRGHRWAAKWGKLIEGDLADGDLVRSALRDHQVESVIHLAADTNVSESVQDPRRYFRNNVANSLNLLEAMQDAGANFLVFSSSCATYGVPEALLIDEDHAQHPCNPYGESKLFIERAIHWYGKAYGVRSAVLRYFNASGADPEGEIGEENDPETRLIPVAIRTALGEIPLMEIFGTDYPTPDGTAIRDYVHVSDLATAHLQALEIIRRRNESLVLNLGTGRGHSVKEVVATVERVSGRKVRTVERPRRPGDPPSLVANPRRAAAMLGWWPRFSALSEIVETAWRWYASNRPRGGELADPDASSPGRESEAPAR